MRSYDNSVFINCPFDLAFRPLFEAVAFAVYDCGFYPRSALEVEDSSEARIEKIIRIIAECRLAVHDISRTQLDRHSRLPRFNMPLELGIFIGAKAFGTGVHRRKAAIVLDTDRYRYQKYISDIAGQDIRAHGRSPVQMIQQVRDFLVTHCGEGVLLPGGDKIVDRYLTFRGGLSEMCAEAHLPPPEQLTFRDMTTLVVAWLRRNPLSPRMVSA
ncbi:hypothetical protein [Longimicrobium sp.]|uniref:hypothetical protein n=1 Tax=Longimicrobium sp. TaxID=2029185 RepID=UPI003B3B4D22